MLDIKAIRKDPNLFKKKLSERNVNFDISNLLNLEKKNRDLIQNKEKLESEKKKISQKKDESQFSKSKSISEEIENMKELNLLSNKPQIYVCNVSEDEIASGNDVSGSNYTVTSSYSTTSLTR